MRKILTLLTAIAVMLMTSVVIAQDGHHGGDGSLHRDELDRESPIELNPTGGNEIGLVYEAYLSPQQEAGEEEDTPPLTPPQFLSTEPSTPREERTSRGHAVLEFKKDLSRAYIHLSTVNVNPDDIVMLHLHCGRPGQLGPIIVDFGLMGDVTELMADEVMTLEITNADIVAVAESGSGIVGAFTAGCPIVPAIPNDRIKTIAGLAMVARHGELYFNLHTAQQTFFGDIRGDFYPADLDD